MAKPATLDGYSDQYTVDCERVLVTLLRGLGPWKESRFERKDAHDLAYCIEHAPEGLDAVVADFGQALAGKHAAVIREALDVLRGRFAHDEATEGYRKDGPVSVDKFELGEGQDAELREARVLRQRQVSDLVDRLLVGIGYPNRETAS